MDSGEDIERELLVSPQNVAVYRLDPRGIKYWVNTNQNFETLFRSCQ